MKTYTLTHISCISWLPQNPTRRWQLQTHTENRWIPSISEGKRQSKVSGTSQKSDCDTLWQHPECLSWLKHNPRNTGCLWKQQAQWNSSFSGQKGMRIVLPIHFRLVDVGQGYLSPVPAAHKGAKHLEFTEMLLQDCHTRLFCEYPSCCTPCCLRLGIPVWQEGPRSACWLPETHRHSKHTVQVPHQLQQQHWESAAPR